MSWPSVIVCRCGDGSRIYIAEGASLLVTCWHPEPSQPEGSV